MNMNHFYFLNNNLLRLDFPGNRTILVQLDEYSGRIITRKKVDTISNVQHTGIWLGRCLHTRRQLVIHNHYKYGTAHIADLESYAYGETVYLKNERCTNDPVTVLKIGLNHVRARKPYRALSYNCQTFTNTACHNSGYSEDAVKWTGRILGGLAIVLLAKSLVQTT